MLKISKLTAAAVLTTFALSGSSAFAQGWLASPETANGEGFQAGALELHPGLGIEFGYDNNVFFEDTDPQAAPLMRLTGHLNFNTRNNTEDSDGDVAPKLRFSGGLAASYFHFFGISARNNVGLDANLDLTIRPEGRVSFRIYTQYGRTVRPFVDSPADATPPTYARNQNTGGAELTFQSRRRVVAATFGYVAGLDFFEDDAFAFVNNIEHQVFGQFTYRFFPSTALVSRTTAHFQNYFDPNEANAGALVQDNRRVHSEIGVNGALTQTLGVTAMIGYAAGFYDVADDFDNVTLNLRTLWKPRPTLSFSLSYQRLFRPSPIGNFTRSNVFSLTGQSLIGSSFLLGANASLSLDQSGIALAPDGMTAIGNDLRREDIRINASIFAEYRFTSYLAASINLGYYGDITDFTYINPPPGGVFPDPGGGFQKFDAWLGLRIFY